MKKLLLIITIFIFSSNLTLAYQWPVNNSLEKTFDKPQRITATLGEYRAPNKNNPKGRLHQGIDINPVEGSIMGTKVYAVEGGEISVIDVKEFEGSEKLKDNDPRKNNSFVSIKSGNKEFNYRHIEPDDKLVAEFDKAKLAKENKQPYEDVGIVAGELLGTIKPLTGLGPHLHFEEKRFSETSKKYEAHNPLASLPNYTDTTPTQLYADSLEITKDLGRYLVQATQANLAINNNQVN